MSEKTDTDAAQTELASVAEDIQAMRSRLARIMESLRQARWRAGVEGGES